MRAGRSILLVEDNVGDQYLAAQAFKSCRSEARLFIVPDGLTAEDYLLKRGKYADTPDPSFILLDLNLPGKTGLDLLRLVKEHARLRQIPVIIFSSSSFSGDIKRAYFQYANCFIVKPHDLDRFFEVIAELDQFWGGVASLPNLELDQVPGYYSRLPCRR